MTHEAIRKAVEVVLSAKSTADHSIIGFRAGVQDVSALLADRDRLAAEVEAKWRPIETAPRSAEPILTINQSGRMAIETGYYAHNMMHAAQLDEEECYYTHWMALPASPEEGTS